MHEKDGVVGLFLNPSLASLSGFEQFAEVCLSMVSLTPEESKIRCEHLRQSISKQGVNPVVVLDEMSNTLCKVLDAFECIRNV